MKRKIITFAVAVFMLTLMSIVQVSAANGEITVTADKAYAKRGETVTYNVSGEGLSDLRGISVHLTYDAEKASYVEGSEDVVVDLFTEFNGINNVENNVTLAAAFEEITDYTGKLFSFSLAIDEDAENGYVGLDDEEIILIDGEGNEIPVNAVISDASVVSEYNVTFDVQAESEEVKSDEIVEYSISMSELNVKGMQFVINYDSDRFELEDIVKDSALDMVTKVVEDGKINVAYYGKDVTTVSGGLFTLALKAKYVSEEEYACAPISISDVKSVGPDGYLDVSYDVVCTTVDVLKDQKIQIVAEPDKLTAGVGEEVSYIVSVNGIDNYRGIQVGLKYDLSKLEFVEAAPLSLMDLADVSFDTRNEGTVAIGCVFADSVSTTAADFAKITFKVKDVDYESFADIRIAGISVSADGYSYANAEYYTSVDEVYVHPGRNVLVTAVPSETLAIPGETVKYTFMLSDVEEFSGMQFNLVYDSDALEYLEITKGSVLSSATLKDIRKIADGLIKGMINYKKLFTGNGELFSVTFKVKNVDFLMQPEIYMTGFVSDNYISQDVEALDIYPVEPALEAISAIDAIGEVSLASKAVIDYARNLYNSLPDEIKERVSNYADLEAAEVRYEEVYEAAPVYEYSVNDSFVNLVQNKPCSEVLTIYIAQYNAEGALITVDMKAVAGTEQITYTKAADTDTVKCFIWGENMVPYKDVECKK